MTTISKLLNRAEERGIKLGLENMHRMDAAFGSPSGAFPSVHIAGTNGKGSVATKIAAALHHSGLKVGLYTSPHISSLQERIQINGQLIPEGKLEEHLTSIFALNFIRPTFFEITTMAALLYFAQEKVDLAVLEVGMGGRLDATNIVTPLLSVITTIDYDHTRYLGTTLDAIAQEKAGIIKPEVPVLLGPNAQPFTLFYSIAKEKNAPLHRLQETFSDFETENRAIARRACELLPYPSSDEALEIQPPCRFEVIQKQIPIILDVAHNPAAFRALFQKLESHFPGQSVRALVALSADKELEPSLALLSSRTSTLHLTQAPFPRAAPVESLSPYIQSKNVILNPDLSSAFDEAYQMASERGELLLITGTFYIMDKIKLKLADVS
ncbi:MAG: Bifunctional protein FolC [Chlamydiae bacterium]|nr:Bifunctional protein FolC [Chlamydiota bacterium]